MFGFVCGNHNNVALSITGQRSGKHILADRRESEFQSRQRKYHLRNVLTFYRYTSVIFCHWGRHTAYPSCACVPFEQCVSCAKLWYFNLLWDGGDGWRRHTIL